MKLLIDECVSRMICAPLEADGHDVVHVVRDLKMNGATDSAILALAKADGELLAES